MATSRLQHQRQERLAKLDQLKNLGINPYPSVSQRTHLSQQIATQYQSLEGKVVTVAGRLMSLREHGKLAFMDLVDQSGKIQLFVKSDVLEPTNSEVQILGFDQLKLIDVGDFVQATGQVTTTKTGQISVVVSQSKLLTKSLRPLPADEIADPELQIRRRYLDLTLKPNRRELFERKAKFWHENRGFLQSRGFIEV